MKFECKYSPGDTVYYLSNDGNIHQNKILGITIWSGYFYYHLYLTSKLESELYLAPEEAKKELETRLPVIIP